MCIPFRVWLLHLRSMCGAATVWSSVYRAGDMSDQAIVTAKYMTSHPAYWTSNIETLNCQHTKLLCHTIRRCQRLGVTDRTCHVAKSFGVFICVYCIRPYFVWHKWGQYRKSTADQKCSSNKAEWTSQDSGQGRPYSFKEGRQLTKIASSCNKDHTTGSLATFSSFQLRQGTMYTAVLF